MTHFHKPAPNCFKAALSEIRKQAGYVESMGLIQKRLKNNANVFQSLT